MTLYQWMALYSHAFTDISNKTQQVIKTKSNRKLSYKVEKGHIESIWGSWMGEIGVYMIVFHCIHVWDSKEKEDLMSNGYEVKAIPVETKITNWDIFSSCVSII